MNTMGSGVSGFSLATDVNRIRPTPGGQVVLALLACGVGALLWSGFAKDFFGLMTPLCNLGGGPAPDPEFIAWIEITISWGPMLVGAVPLLVCALRQRRYLLGMWITAVAPLMALAHLILFLNVPQTLSGFSSPTLMATLAMWSFISLRASRLIKLRRSAA
jgi:hypothetical protein